MRLSAIGTDLKSVLALLVLVAVGPGLVVAAFVSFTRRARFLARAGRTEGIVADAQLGSVSDEGTDSYRLTVRYSVPGWGEREFTEKVQLRRKAGDRISVLYDPAYPERARIGYRWREVWGTAAFLLVAGAFGTLFLVVFLNS